MSDFFDAAAHALATADARPVSRGRALRLAAGIGASLGAASFLRPLLDTARANDYCLQPCLHAADNALAQKSDITKAAVLKSYLTTALPVVRFAFLLTVGVLVIDDYGDYYAERARCRRPNCGNPTRYPPPPPPSTAPPPPPPPGGGSGPCGTCTAYCLVCPAVTGGYLCCALPPTPTDPNPCCPKG